MVVDVIPGLGGSCHIQKLVGLRMQHRGLGSGLDPSFLHHGLMGIDHLYVCTSNSFGGSRSWSSWRLDFDMWPVGWLWENPDRLFPRRGAVRRGALLHHPHLYAQSEAISFGQDAQIKGRRFEIGRYGPVIIRTYRCVACPQSGCVLRDRSMVLSLTACRR